MPKSQWLCISKELFSSTTAFYSLLLRKAVKLAMFIDPHNPLTGYNNPFSFIQRFGLSPLCSWMTILLIQDTGFATCVSYFLHFLHYVNADDDNVDPLSISPFNQTSYTSFTTTRICCVMIRHDAIMYNVMW